MCLAFGGFFFLAGKDSCNSGLEAGASPHDGSCQSLSSRIGLITRLIRVSHCNL